MDKATSSTTIRLSLGVICLGLIILFAIGLLGGYVGSRFSKTPITVLPNGDRTIVPVSQQVTISPSKAGEDIVANQGRSVLLLAQQGTKDVVHVGTGVVLTNDGVVMSTQEVPNTPLFAIGEDGALTALNIIGKDVLSGITFFRIPDQILSPVTLAQSAPTIGAQVMSIFRDGRTMHLAASRHTLSSIFAPENEEAPGIQQVAQLSGEVSSLPIGTAFFNDDGRLIGALRGEKTPTILLVPDITAALSRLSANTLAQNPYATIGFTITWNLENDSTQTFGIRAVVSGVLPKTPAFDAGLKTGDIITAINGKTITWDSNVSQALTKTPITLSLRRQLEERTIAIP